MRIRRGIAETSREQRPDSTAESVKLILELITQSWYDWMALSAGDAES